MESFLSASTNPIQTISFLAVIIFKNYYFGFVKRISNELVVGESSNRDMREAALRSRIEELERENASLNQRLSNKTN